MKDVRNQNRIRTKRLAACALLSAIGVAILYLGALIEVLDLSAVVIASFVCVFVTIEMGGAWPWTVYAVISILSLLLLPQKSPALLFLLFGGYYPILKAYIERLRGFLPYLLKFAVFNIALTLAMFLLKELFLAPDLAWMNGLLWIVIVYGSGNLVFLLYDFALTRVISKYVRVLRARLRVPRF